MPFSGPKQPICPEQKNFGANHYYYFHLPNGIFHSAKFKNILTVDPELLLKRSICLPKEFFWKIINVILIYLLASFIVKNFLKSSSSGYRIMRMQNFWVQNGPFPQMRMFSENLIMSLVSFIHAYLHAKNQRQIDINFS